MHFIKRKYNIKYMDKLIRIFENENFIVDYNSETKKYRVSIFENSHYCDECEFDEYKKDGFPSCSVGEIYWYAPRAYREPEKVKVSMLQQKADKSWKIRLSPQNSGFGVFDITLEKFNNYCFTTEEKAMKYLEEWRR